MNEETKALSVVNCVGWWNEEGRTTVMEPLPLAFLWVDSSGDIIDLFFPPLGQDQPGGFAEEAGGAGAR